MHHKLPENLVNWSLALAPPRTFTKKFHVLKAWDHAHGWLVDSIFESLYVTDIPGARFTVQGLGSYDPPRDSEFDLITDTCKR